MIRLSHFPVIGIILAVFVALAAIYSGTTPIFEASDEVSHYAVVQHIADTGALPMQQPGVKTPWEQEGSQPPLYYLLVSPVARLIDTRDVAERMTRNPLASPGDPSLDANRNLVIHSPAEDFPWRNTTLAVHLIRFISIVMGAGTIVLGYALARRIFPDRPSLSIGTALLIAFNPMFIFITASVNNDNLTIMLTSLALYLSVLCWYEPPGRVDRLRWARRLLLGVVLGGAALSKISGLTLLPIVALIFTVRHLRGRDWRGWIFSGVLIALPVLLIAGWWYLRNVNLYGELFGLDTMVAIAGPRALTVLDLVPEFDGFRYSYWALFGAVNIVTFPLAYVIFDLFTLLSVVGVVVWFVRNRRSERCLLLLILAGYVLLVFGGVIRWTMMTPASQGRLMFPAITAISLLMWLGWETIFNVQFSMINDQSSLSNHQRPISNLQLLTSNWGKLRWLMPAFMLIVAVVVPFRDIAPTYAGPQMMSEQQLRPDLKRLEVDYGDQLRLIGYRAAEPLARSDSTEFTLYWQCLKPMGADYSVFVIVYGRQLEEVGKRDAYPYHGLYATRQCEPGQVFADPYRIPIKANDVDRPTVLHAQIGLRDRQTQNELAAMAGGQTLSAVMLDVGKLSPPAQEYYHTMDYRVGDSFTLLDARIERLDGAPHLSLTWQATAIPLDAYTTFVHVLEASGDPIGQADGPALNGDYPTDWWSPGETIVDTRPLTLPPEADRVTIGLYRLADGARLPIVDQDGQRVVNDEIVISVQP
jgi:hypothetical protein